MNEKTILESAAKLIADEGIINFEVKLIEYVKKQYGVEGMGFRKISKLIYCLEGKETENMGLRDISLILDGLDRKRISVYFQEKFYLGLDEIRKFVLTKKLAGIK